MCSCSWRLLLFMFRLLREQDTTRGVLTGLWCLLLSSLRKRSHHRRLGIGCFRSQGIDSIISGTQYVLGHSRDRMCERLAGWSCFSSCALLSKLVHPVTEYDEASTFSVLGSGTALHSSKRCPIQGMKRGAEGCMPHQKPVMRFLTLPRGKYSGWIRNERVHGGNVSKPSTTCRHMCAMAVLSTKWTTKK